MEDKILKYLWKMSLFIEKNDLTLSDEKDGLTIMDQWIIEKCIIIRNNYLSCMNNNNFDNAKKFVDEFLINDFYTIFKTVLENKIVDKKDIEVSKNVLLNIFLEILKMYCFYNTDVVKFIYTNLYLSADKLLLKDNLEEYVTNDNVLYYGEDIKNIILDVNKFRRDVNISRKKAIDSITLNIKKDDALLFSKSLDDILKLINAKNVNVEFGDETYIESISNDKINVKKR